MKAIITLLALLLFTSIHQQLLACNCEGQWTVQEEVKHADAVLVGKIISKQIITLTDDTIQNKASNETSMRNRHVTNITFAQYELAVKDIYKGRMTNDTLIIYTGSNDAACGIMFEIGQLYIVYGNDESYLSIMSKTLKLPKGKNAFWTNACTRTTEYNNEELTEIEKYAKKQQIEKEEVNYIDPETMPIFKDGGDIGLRKFLRENLNYQKIGDCVDGKVIVSFTVDTLGMVKDIEIKRGISPAIDNEVLRVVKMLTFIPAKRNGRPIEKKLFLPVSISLTIKSDK